MKRRAPRLLGGLGEDVDHARRAIDAVEQAFDIRWLEQAQGTTLMQRLWRRSDRLASVELYTLGCAILRLQREGQHGWLKETVRNIKKSASPHGPVAEIVAYGQLSFGGRALEPMPKNTPGYDFRVAMDQGKTLYLSVKNHDVTQSSKEFNRQSRLIRKAWREKLKLEKLQRALRIYAIKPLDVEDFAAVKQYVQGSLDLHSTEPVEVRPNVMVVAHPLHYEIGALSNFHVSDMVLVCAPAPEEEQLRFRKNIRIASEKFRKNITRSEDGLNVIYMRVHANADMDYLMAVAKDIMEDAEACVDAIIFYQPTYARNEQGHSLLNNAYRIVFNMRYAKFSKGQVRDIMKIIPPVGSISFERAPMVLLMDGEARMEIPPNSYVFQQGDVYLLSQPDGDSMTGELRSPASGIREHVVFKIGNQSLAIGSKVHAQEDDLSIV